MASELVCLAMSYLFLNMPKQCSWNFVNVLVLYKTYSLGICKKVNIKICCILYNQHRWNVCHELLYISLSHSRDIIQLCEYISLITIILCSQIFMVFITNTNTVLSLNHVLFFSTKHFNQWYGQDRFYCDLLSCPIPSYLSFLNIWHYESSYHMCIVEQLDDFRNFLVI